MVAVRQKHAHAGPDGGFSVSQGQLGFSRLWFSSRADVAGQMFALGFFLFHTRPKQPLQGGEGGLRAERPGQMFALGRFCGPAG